MEKEVIRERQVLASFDSVLQKIIVKIVEGEVYRVRNIIVEGNEKIDTRKVLLDVQIKAENGDPEKLNNTLTQMKDSDFTPMCASTLNLHQKIRAISTLLLKKQEHEQYHLEQELAPME